MSKKNSTESHPGRALATTLRNCGNGCRRPLPGLLGLLALLGLSAAASAAPNHTTGVLSCQDGTAISDCEISLKYHDSVQVVGETTAYTAADGSFSDTLLCPFSNQVGEYIEIYAKCCNQAWKVSSESCSGGLGNLVCDSCGGSGCAAPPSGLVAWWPFDEEDGPNSEDVAGHHTGVWRGNPFPNLGEVNHSLTFEGDSEVEVADSNALDFGAAPSGNFSVDFWLRLEPGQNSGIVSLVDKRESPAHPRGYAVFLSSGRLALQLAEGGSSFCDSTTALGCTNYDSGVTLSEGNWIFVAVTVNRSAADGIHWYVDGDEAGNRGNPLLREASLANGAPLHIGAHAFSGRSLNGSLDELEIFDRPMTGDEITAIWQAGNHGKCREGLQSQWDASMCSNATSATTSTQVCNFSTAEQSYDLVFTPASAADEVDCQLAGPTDFTLLGGTTLPLLVPAQSCREVKVAVARPAAVPANASGLSCYRTTLRNTLTGSVYEDLGSLNVREVCGRPRDWPFNRPSDIGDPVPFEVFNSSDSPINFQFQFEAMASSLNPADVILSLSEPGSDPMAANASLVNNVVSGEVPIAAGASARISVLASLLADEPLNFQNILLRDRSNGAVLASAGLRAFAAVCSPSATVLCLNGGRFEVRAAFKDFVGVSGGGQAAPLTVDTGYFYFFSPENVELMVKVLDGRAINDHFWVLFGALSDVDFVITVHDTQDGWTRTYANAAGHLASVVDIEALPGSLLSGGLALAESAAVVVVASAEGNTLAGRTPISRTVASWPPAATAASGSCVPSPTVLCLDDSRFKVEVTWRDFLGQTGVGRAFPITTATGSFWFFAATNLELGIKILDARAINHSWWVFYGALSNVEYRITVTDTATGRVNTYFNPSGNVGSSADLEAFPE